MTIVVSADPKPRSTSHAKTVDLDQQKNALDRALKLQKEFERANTAKGNSLTQQKSLREENAVHVSHAPRPQPHLRPPDGEIRRQVDRQIDDEKRARESERAKELLEIFKEQQKTRESENDRDRSR
jgi:hypothetical protein